MKPKDFIDVMNDVVDDHSFDYLPLTPDMEAMGEVAQGAEPEPIVYHLVSDALDEGEQWQRSS